MAEDPTPKVIDYETNNKTIDNIRNSVGLGRMSEPTNVYTGTNAFRNDVLNTLRSALGNSVKSFFNKP